MTNNNQGTKATEQRKFESVEQEIAFLREQNALLQKQANAKNSLGIKVSPKGGIAVYGLGRFPLVLYKSQWDQLLTRIEDIKQFMVDHAHELTIKPTKDKVVDDSETQGNEQDVA
jgi:hypothetical protein